MDISGDFFAFAGFGGGIGIGFTSNGQAFIEFTAQAEVGEVLNFNIGLQGSVGRNTGDLPTRSPQTTNFVGAQAAFGVGGVMSGGWTHDVQSGDNSFNTSVGHIGGGVAGQVAGTAGTNTKFALNDPLCN